MKALQTLLRWDLRVMSRYQITTAAFAVGAIYVLLFSLVPVLKLDSLLIMLIFFDPAMLGMTFIGALILFEKSDNTLQAMATTPLKPWQYIGSKATALTLIMLPVAFIMAGVGHGWQFDYGLFTGGLILSSYVYAFVGIVIVAKTQAMNEYIIRLALIFIPISLPLLNLFGIVESWIWYVIPSQASLSLFQAAFGDTPAWEMLYGFGYLIVLLPISYYLAERAYRQHLRT